MDVMLMAGGTAIVSFFTLLILLLLAVTALLLVMRVLLRRRHHAAPVVRPVVRERLVGVEITRDRFDAMKSDLELLILGDGRDDEGRPWGIYRYRSRTTGKLYDVSCSATTTRILEYSAQRDSVTDAVG